MAVGTAPMSTSPTFTPKPQPKSTAPLAPLAPSRAATICCLGAAIASGVLLYTCFHPLAWGFLGWVALAPMLLLVRSQARPSLVYLFAFLGGLAFHVPALMWMSVAHSSMVAAWIALSIYMSLYFPAAIWLIRCFDRRGVPMIVSVPLVWIALEYFRCIFLSGFPWYLLAHTQHDALMMIQIADLGGVFLVSFVVAAVNAFAFDVVYQFPEVRSWFGQRELEQERTYANIDFLNRGVFADWLFRRNLILEAAALAALVGATCAYGIMQNRQDHLFAGPTVSMLQSNIDQRLREGIGGDPDREKVGQTVREHFSALCVRATKNIEPKPDLIIWPETSFPSPWYDVSPQLPIEQVPREWRDAARDIRARLKDLAGQHTQIPHLIGINAYCLEADLKDRHYNSALLLSEKGEVEGRFDKIHRVPFGEYIPLKDWLPFLARLSPYEGDFGVTPGEKMTRFPLKKYHFGVLICYEDTDPFLARRYVEQNDDGPPVDFLVNISNDGWFDGSAEHEEHLAVCRFRAIECRRSMVRAVNMGVSAVIDSNGRVLKPTFYPGSNPPVFMITDNLKGIPSLERSDWHHFKKQALVLISQVPIDRRFSLYATIGDVLPITCWVVLAGGAAWTLYKRRASRSASAAG